MLHGRKMQSELHCSIQKDFENGMTVGEWAFQSKSQ